MTEWQPMATHGLSRVRSKEIYAGLVRDGAKALLRELCQRDLFYLVSFACRRRDMDVDWIYARVREVEASPDGHLDLWAREHYKSSIITFGLTLRDILRDPELTVGIFSHTKPIAKAFMRQLKTEMEGNAFLKGLFPDVLWSKPDRESPCWSMETGLVVRRRGNPKECTIEASGLVDGQPTSKHFGLLVYDDVVTKESVSTPEQIQQTTDAWSLSLNLGSAGGRRRTIGTRYHANDTYAEMLRRQAVKPRIHPATDDGTVGGRPVLLSRELLDERRTGMGPYVFACQMLQDPLADTAMGFKHDWLRRWTVDATKVRGWNVYALVDPASERKRGSDRTAMFVVGLAPDLNYYILDMVCDRMNLTQRTEYLFRLVRAWRPLKVGYEKYGLQSDIEHIRWEMELQNWRFQLQPLGGQTPKKDRIRALVPAFEQGRMYLPDRLLKMDVEGRLHDLAREFVDDEFLCFPVCRHDDMLDCLARIKDPDLGASFPSESQDARGGGLTFADSRYRVLP